MRMMADDNQTTPETNAAAMATEMEPGKAPPPADAAAAAAAAELAEMKDKLLRALADARQYAVTSFAREMLQVGDNLRRALEAVPADKRKDADKTLSALLEGVEVTERGLDQTLGKFGVKRIDAKGKKFDPSFHQAMFEVPRDDVPPGTVVDEMQAGYVIGDRVLKPALVVTAKRAPAAAANDDAPKAGAPAGPSGGVGDGG
jgi:molecular chaperone GrpE